MNKKLTEAERQLSSFVDKFDPKHRALIRAVRTVLRRRFPTAHELVYDNYNFFVIGYCSTERPSDCLVSIAAGSNGVALCFMHGAKLPDPKKILTGSGKQTRFLRLPTASVLQRPEVEALLAIAESRAAVPLATKARGSLVIRSVSVKQRPRRK